MDNHNHHMIWASPTVDEIDNLNYSINYPKEHPIIPDYNNDHLYGATTTTNNNNNRSTYSSWNYYANTPDPRLFFPWFTVVDSILLDIFYRAKM